MDRVNAPFIHPPLHIFYTPAKMFDCIGRVWALEKDMFYYNIRPRQCFSVPNIDMYHKEWEYRVDEGSRLREELRACYLKAPKRRSLTIDRVTHQQLEKAVNMIRHENNQMQIRLNNCKAIQAICRPTSGLSEGEVELQLQAIEKSPEYSTDGDLSDEDA